MRSNCWIVAKLYALITRGQADAPALVQTRRLGRQDLLAGMPLALN